jgi:peptidoglycan/xylan/chitin deacetylase (PgdA/CDA1 family)
MPFATLARRLVGRLPGAALAILGFHNLTPTFADPYTAASFPRLFERLVKKAARRFECVTVTDGVRRLASGMEPRRPMLAFIFDDGYADLHRVAWPILARAGIPATSYVIVDCLESGRVPWYDELGRIVFATPRPELALDFDGRRQAWALPAERSARVPVYWDVIRHLKATFTRELIGIVGRAAAAHDLPPHDPAAEPMMMTVAQARELADGGFELGCHSITHPILPRIDDADLAHEIAGGRARLTQLLGRPVTSFCFPNGDNDERCQRQAERSGYEAAVSCALGANPASALPRFQLRRVPMSEKMGALWPWHTLYRVRGTLLESAATTPS